MAVTFAMIEQPDHLRVKVSGERVPGEHVAQMLAGWTQVAGRCRAAGLRRVLGVSTMTGTVPTIDAFDIAKAGREIFGGVVDRLAYVVYGSEEMLRVNRFAEDVSVNRGLTMRVFDNEQEARRWLLG